MEKQQQLGCMRLRVDGKRKIQWWAVSKEGERRSGILDDVSPDEVPGLDALRAAMGSKKYAEIERVGRGTEEAPRAVATIEADFTKWGIEGAREEDLLPQGGVPIKALSVFWTCHAMIDGKRGIIRGKEPLDAALAGRSDEELIAAVQTALGPRQVKAIERQARRTARSQTERSE